MVFFKKKRGFTTFLPELETLWYARLSREGELKCSSEEDSRFPGGALAPPKSGDRFGKQVFACAAAPGGSATASPRPGFARCHGPHSRGNTALPPPSSCILTQQDRSRPRGVGGCVGGGDVGEQPSAPRGGSLPRRRRGGDPAATRRCESKGGKCAPLAAGPCLPLPAPALPVPAPACPCPACPCLPPALPVRPAAGLGPAGAGAPVC